MTLASQSDNQEALSNEVNLLQSKMADFLLSTFEFFSGPQEQSSDVESLDFAI
jgi:hypothetical protein